MRFNVHSAVFSGGDRTQRALDALLTRVEDEVHEVRVSDADNVEQSDWFASQRPTRRKLIEGISTASLYPGRKDSGSHRNTFDVVDEQSAICAEKLAYTPLAVLVENADSDGALVEAALKAYGARWAVELCFGTPTTLVPRAMEFDSRGGHGELRKLIDKYLQDAVQTNRPARIVVVADSDGEWPGDVKPYVLELRSHCSAMGIRCLRAPPVRDHEDRRMVTTWIGAW